MTERSPRWARVRPGLWWRVPTACPLSRAGPSTAPRPAPRPRGSPGRGRSRDPLRQKPERVPGARRSRGRQSRVESYICPLGKCRTLGNRREMSVWRDLSAAWRGATTRAERSTRRARVPAAQHLGVSLSIPPGDPGEGLLPFRIPCQTLR